jgi:LacI family transcriptional regulator
VNRRPSDPGVSYVVSDNEQGAAELTRHLLSLGHRRIGFIAGPAYARNAVERLSGFQRAMAEAAGAEPLVVEGDFSVDSGREAVLGWIGQAHPPTAVIAVNDAGALGALGVLSQNNLKSPRDVAVAGFDGTQLSSSPLIRLTTVDQHIARLGRKAVKLLLKQIDSSGKFQPVHEVLPTQLLVRDSTVADHA